MLGELKTVLLITQSPTALVHNMVATVKVLGIVMKSILLLNQLCTPLIPMVMDKSIMVMI